jgi:DNA-binding NtrC family response regulator
MIEHMVITSKGNVISVESLPAEIRGIDRDMSTRSDSIPESDTGDLRDFRVAKKELIERFEKNYLRKLLEKNNWNISQSAREIKMHRSSFQRLVRKYGLKK